MVRRILHEIKLDKIAAVDRPCQEGARAVIMKRDFTADERKALAEKGDAMPDGSFPIQSKADLSNAIKAHGRASDPGAAKAHIIRRAKALDATDQLPDGWLAKAADGHHPLNMKDPSMSAITKALGLADNATETQVAEAIAKFVSESAETKSALATMTKVAALSPSVRAHYETLLKGDKKKDAEDLLDMGADEAEEKVKKAQAGDEVLELHGQSIRKSVVGDAMFTVMKAQAQEIADSKAAIAKAEDAAATARFEKKATETYPHLAGSVAERASVLKFLDTAPEAIKKAAETMLAAAEGAAAFAFTKRGVSFTKSGEHVQEGEGGEAQAKLDKRIAEIRKADATIPMAKAYAQALRENPELYAELSEPADA